MAGAPAIGPINYETSTLLLRGADGLVICVV